MKRRLISLLLILALMISILPMTAMRAEAASYPIVFFGNSSNEILKDSVATIKLKVLAAYKNEGYSIRIYQGDYADESKLVASADDTYYNTSTIKEINLSWNTNGLPTGTYTVVVQLSFYTYFEWHNAPNSRTTKFVIVDQLSPHEHSWDDGKVTTDPTCTKDGVKTYTCSTCGETYTESIPALGHDLDVGVVIKEPTESNPVGIKRHYCYRCAEGFDLPFLKDGSEMFEDVMDSQSFYFVPVYWAANRNITKGTDKTHFGPTVGCTRAQVVTFLWRTAGSPKPKNKKNPFTDVKKGAYYYNAVLWAMEKGITNGIDKTHFAPDDTCTRGQIVTFLWRFKETPAPKSTNTKFTDVSAGAFYAKAVAWAVEKKITNGMDKTHFAPDATCTRGQIVTFLYRAMT